MCKDTGLLVTNRALSDDSSEGAAVQDDWSLCARTWLCRYCRAPAHV